MLRPLLLGLILILAAGVGHAACGDGVLDGGEQCDAGPDGTAWRCCSATCQRLDADWDGICDGDDVCDQSVLARLSEATLRVNRIEMPLGDERMRFTGRLRFPAVSFLDPAVTGFRFSLHGEVSSAERTAFTPMIAARIPGGPGWSTGGSTWRFRDPRGRNAGITSVVLKLIVPAPIVPGDTTMTLAYTIVARRGGYLVMPDMVKLWFPGATSWGQLQTQMALGSSPDGAQTCAQRAFPSYVSLPTVPCVHSARGNTMTCGSPPPIGPCRVGEARDVLVCEILAVAAAEEAYKAEHGTYFSGSCIELPGYTPTPEALISCSLVASQAGFSVFMASPYVPGSYCQYQSLVVPSLICS